MVERFESSTALEAEKKHTPSVSHYRPRKVAGDVGREPVTEIADVMAWAAAQADMASHLVDDLDSLKDAVVALQEGLAAFSSGDLSHVQSRSWGEPLLTWSNAEEGQQRPLPLEKVSPDGNSARGGDERGGVVQNREAKAIGPAVTFQLGMDDDDEDVMPTLENQGDMPTAVFAAQGGLVHVESQDVVKLVHHMQKSIKVSKLAPDENKSGGPLSSLLRLPPEPTRSGKMHHFLHSSNFERLLAGVIVLNSAFIGLALEERIKNPEKDPPVEYVIGEALFLAFYCVELLAKLCVHRLYFFVNDDWMWNCLDFVLVIVSVQDLILSNVGGSGDRLNVAFMRILRLLRVSKMFRVFRVMLFFRELRVLLLCILGSIRSLLWSIMLITLFYYVFAVIFMNGTASYAKSHQGSPHMEEVLEWRGSLPLCMHSLYMASLGGADWRDIAEPLLKVGDQYYALFLFYIAFMLLAVLNIVTGVFVESAIQTSRSDVEGIIRSQIEADRNFEESISGLFYTLDSDGDGYIGKDEMLENLNQGPHLAFFATLGLEIADVHEFSDTLVRFVGNDSVDHNNFIRACRRFRATAKFSDMYLLRAGHVETTKRLKEIYKLVDLICQKLRLDANQP